MIDAQTVQTLQELAGALQQLREQEFKAPSCLSRHWEKVEPPEGMSMGDEYDLEAVNIPPEIYEENERASEDAEGKVGHLTLFADDVSLSSMKGNFVPRLSVTQVVPIPANLNGWTVRSLILDIITLFEVNRKESANTLLLIRKHLAPNTFKPLPSTSNPPEAEPSSTLSLESLIVQTLLQTMCALPRSPLSLLYYGSVITELCKSSPNTVAPPVGRAVRKIFTMLGGEGLDEEIGRRVEEWFAIHLSNFGYQWMWKEWCVQLIYILARD